LNKPLAINRHGNVGEHLQVVIYGQELEAETC